MREEQIRRLVADGKITKQEGDRLLQALERSRSGEAEREIARKAGKKARKRSRLFICLAIAVIAVLAAGLGLGLYFGLRENESATDLFKKGETAFLEGDYQEAADCYLAGLEKDPKSSVGYNLLGMAYRFSYNQTGSAEYRNKEIEAFRKAIELDPNNPAPYVNLGATLFYQGQKQEAVEYLKKALEVYPQHPDRKNIEEMIRQAQGTLPENGKHLTRR